MNQLQSQPEFLLSSGTLSENECLFSSESDILLTRKYLRFPYPYYLWLQFLDNHTNPGTKPGLNRSDRQSVVYLPLTVVFPDLILGTSYHLNICTIEAAERQFHILRRHANHNRHYDHKQSDYEKCPQQFLVSFVRQTAREQALPLSAMLYCTRLF